MEGKRTCVQCSEEQPLEAFPPAVKKIRVGETPEELAGRRLTRCRTCVATNIMCPHRRYPSQCLICAGPDSKHLCACGRLRTNCQPCADRIGCPHGLLMFCWRCDQQYCLRIWLNREYGCEHFYESGRYPLMSTAMEKELLGCGLDDAVKILNRLHKFERSEDYLMLWVIDARLPLTQRYRVWNIEVRRIPVNGAFDLAAAGPGEAETAAHPAATAAAAVAFLAEDIEAELGELASLGEGDILLTHLAELGEDL